MVSWFRKLSLAGKATLAFSLTAGAFLLLLAGTTYLYAKRELQQTIATNQTTMVSSLAAQLDERLGSADRYLRNLAEHLQRQPASGSLQAMLNHHDEAALFFDAGLLLLSPHGRIVAEVPYHAERIGLDRSQRDYFTQAMATGKPGFSAPYRLELAPQPPVIALMVPLKNQQGRITGILVGRHLLRDKGFLEDLIDRPIGTSGYFYLFNRQRTLLLHPDHSRILTTMPGGSNQAVEAALNGWHGTVENNDSTGQTGLTTVQPLKNAPWYLAAHYPLTEAYAPLQRARYAFAMLFAAAITLTLAVVYFSMRSVVKPLVRLSEHLQMLDSKQGDERLLPVTSQDEVGRLTAVFNDLLQELDDDTAALEESAEVYRIVTEFTAEVSLWQLENGDVRYISPNCFETFGYLAAEFYADPRLLEVLVHPEDRELWQGHLPGSCSLAGDGLEIKMVVKDGSIRYFRHYCHQVVDRQGRRNGVRSSFLDISGQLQIESRARKLSRAVEQSSSTIVITDAQGIIEYVNPSFTRCSGYSADEAIGNNPRILKSGATTAEEYAELWHTISNGREWRGEFRNKRKDGSLYWESAAISPLTDKHGVITGYLAVKEDITEQRTAEQRLRELFQQVEQAKQEWEQTLDHLHDFILLTDAQHRIKRYNRILSDMAGTTFHDLVGVDWRQLLQELGFRFAHFNGCTGELLHKHLSRTYDINVYPILDAQQRLLGFVISLNDTTELRNTTQELERALAELGEAQLQVYQQEKMASIGQLAAGVAHEINNPMGFITSNLSTLDKYVGRLTEFIGVVEQALQGCCADNHAAPVLEARKRLKIDRILEDAHQLIAESQDGAARVRRIVQDLKSFSRVDQAETEQIDLNAALETTINIAWNEIKYVADLKREFGDIPMVKCFPQQLHQVFLNLLVNAAHAMGENRGEITVRTEQEGNSVLVKVSDTGCGIPAEIQKRIFEPFFTTKEVGKGTGLGLSISYDIVKKHGGTIEVVSETGRGTTFTVRLPIADDVVQHGEPS